MNCDRKTTTRKQSTQSYIEEPRCLSINCKMKITKELMDRKLSSRISPSKVLRAEAASFEPAFQCEYNSLPFTRKDLSANAQVFIPNQFFESQESSMPFNIERIENLNFSFSFEHTNSSVKIENKDPKIKNIFDENIKNTENIEEDLNELKENPEKLEGKTEENTENSSESSEKTSKNPLKNGKFLKKQLQTTPKEKRIYDQSKIQSLKTIFEQDPNFHKLPEILQEIINRSIIPSTSKTLKNDEASNEIIWRKSKTIEEQKILNQAKEYQKKLSISQDEQILVTKSLKSTLNKLSPNNFEKLSQILLETCKKSYDYLKLVVSGIFEKAWSEKKYTQMYSDLCKTLKTELENFEFPEIKLHKTRNYFKYELLKLCEETFSYLNKEPTPEDSDHQNIGKLKIKTLGNVRFIGELFNVNLISAKIVLECINGLLELYESEGNEDKLEGACLLLQTGGSSFERRNLKPATNRVYEKLEKLMKSSISSRIKFKIMDLTEFRANGWENMQKEVIKKLEDLHKDFYINQSQVLK